MKWKALALTLLVGAAAPAASWAQGAAVEETRDQGILYFKKKLYKQALATLKRSYALPGGKTDFRTVYYLAQTSYKMLLLEEAFQRAKEADKLAGADEKQKAATQELLGEMSALYGGVTFQAAKGETNKKGRIFFEAKTGIINKDKKARFNAIRERFRTTDVELPTTVYLPYGEYTANKVPFSLVQGEDPPTLEIFLQVVVDEQEDSNVWWYVGIGGAVAVAAGVAAVVLLQDPGTETRDQVRIGAIKDPALGGM